MIGTAVQTGANDSIACIYGESETQPGSLMLTNSRPIRRWSWYRSHLHVGSHVQRRISSTRYSGIPRRPSTTCYHL